MNQYIFVLDIFPYINVINNNKNIQFPIYLFDYEL